MMRMLQSEIIRSLADYRTQGDSPVLSLYLNLDPSNPANRRGGYRVVLDGMLKDIEAQIKNDTQGKHFQEDAEWVRQKAEHYLPKGKSLVLFCDVSESFFHEDSLPLRMPNQAWFGSTPYVRPLLEAWEEYPRYGVVLAEREKARFFVILMGAIEEVTEMAHEPPVKHRSSAGSDHMRSQMIFQRRAAKWSEEFLKDVSDRLQLIVGEYQIDRLVLGGPEDVTAELKRLLPRTLLAKVADRVKMPMSARTEDVLSLSYPIIEAIEREQERNLVQDLVTMAHKSKAGSEKAVVGFSPTLGAVNQGRVHRLIYPQGIDVQGFQCRSCGVLLDHAPSGGLCPYCSNSLEETEDLLWAASERVLSMGGRIEEIRDAEAKMELTGAGDIGAYLR